MHLLINLQQASTPNNVKNSCYFVVYRFTTDAYASDMLGATTYGSEVELPAAHDPNGAEHLRGGTHNQNICKQGLRFILSYTTPPSRQIPYSIHLHMLSSQSCISKKVLHKVKLRHSSQKAFPQVLHMKRKEERLRILRNILNNPTSMQGRSQDFAQRVSRLQLTKNST